MSFFRDAAFAEIMKNIHDRKKSVEPKPAGPPPLNMGGRTVYLGIKNVKRATANNKFIRQYKENAWASLAELNARRAAGDQKLNEGHIGPDGRLQKV